MMPLRRSRFQSAIDDAASGHTSGTYSNDTSMSTGMYVWLYLRRSDAAGMAAQPPPPLARTARPSDVSDNGRPIVRSAPNLASRPVAAPCTLSSQSVAMSDAHRRLMASALHNFPGRPLTCPRRGSRG